MVLVDPLSAGAALRGTCARSVRVVLFRVLHGAERHPHPLHRTTAAAQQRVLDLLPELVRDVIVDERVQAAVEAGQAQCGDVEAIAVISPAVFLDRVVNHQHHITGDEADQERYEHCDNEDHGSLAGFTGTALNCGVPKRTKEKNVSNYDDQHWDEEHKTCHYHEIIIGQLNALQLVFRLIVLLTDKGDVMAGSDVKFCGIKCLLVEVQRRSADPYEDPDTHRYDDCNLVVFPLLGEWVSADPVPLDA